MDKKLLGNFIIAFPTAAYITFVLVLKDSNVDAHWSSVLIAIIISSLSYTIGTKIKNKGEAE